MSFAEEMARLVAAYPARAPRHSLRDVASLRQALADGPPPPRAACVVGTNGKTSTATYLARILTEAGTRTGLYVSPHLGDWTERIRIDDSPCDPELLLRAVTAVDRVARSGGEKAEGLRFFDVLTLAAERIFADAGVSVAVYEAGIGGRLDATRTLESGLVLLSSVAIDHAEILGEQLSEILVEKLLVAPPGATVLSFHLDPELDRLAQETAADAGFRIVWVDRGRIGMRNPTPELPSYLESALALADAASRALIEAPSTGPSGIVDLSLPGRFELGARDGVGYVLDAAHNEAAWEELGAELSRRAADLGSGPVIALISLSAGKRRDGLAGALRSVPGLKETIVTRHSALAAEAPATVADELSRAGLPARTVEDVGEAIPLAFDLARCSAGRVVAFGSTHLVGDVRAFLGEEGIL